MTWFKVDDSFHSHPKACASSLAALGLWAVAGSWSGDHLTDGFVPDHVIPLLTRGTSGLADELVAAGLWRRTRGGFRFHDWKERNPTREEITAVRANKSSGGQLGNHRRWHVDRDVQDANCAFCQPKRLSPTDRSTDRLSDIATDRHANPPDPTRPDPEEQPPNPPPAKPARRGRPTDDPAFNRFWAAYPRKQGKGQALDRWKQHVVTGGTDAETVIRGAEHYRDDPRRKPDYTKLPATWLNGLCWEDQPVEHSRSSEAWWDN